jgi:TPR repeat protein
MEKAAKLLTTVLALWLSAATWANGADTFEEPTKYNRAKHINSAKTSKVSAWQAKARADALLGFKYEHGLGVPQSFEVAADLYLRAAEQGDPTGQYFLGLMYDKGRGVWQDGILAYKWLNLAAARAPARYREQYLRLRQAAASKLTQDQLYMGQELAIQWVPKPQW